MEIIYLGEYFVYNIYIQCFDVVARLIRRDVIHVREGINIE